MASVKRRLPILAVCLILLFVWIYSRTGASHEYWKAVAEVAIPKSDKPFAHFEDKPASNDATVEPPPSPRKPRRAIVTSVWDGNYASLALFLGWSIKKHNNLDKLGVELVLLTVHDTEHGSGGITAENATRLEAVGWKLRAEDYLTVPGLRMEKIQPHRRKNLNKLKIFGWEEYDKIVFMDADTACKGPIAELFEMPGDFAAAPDSWHDIEIDSRFNSGLMVFRPSQAIFKDMMRKVTNPAFHPENEGDQAFLQNYWKYKFFGLPLRYNLNLIMHNNHRTAWDHLWRAASIIHFTVRKPVERWEPPGHCHKPGDKKDDGCEEWEPLKWYADQFLEMRRDLGFEHEIGLLG